MQVFPEAHLNMRQAPAWLSLVLLVAALGVLLWLPRPEIPAQIEATGALLLLLAVLPALEFAAGRWVLPLVVGLCIGLAWVVSTLDGRALEWSVLAGSTGAGLVGFSFGLLGKRRVRPLYLLPLSVSSWVCPAAVLAVLWLMLELVIRAVSPEWDLLPRLITALAAALCGLLFGLLGLLRSGGGTRFTGSSIEDGRAQAALLLESRDLKNARQLLGQLAEQFPGDRQVREMRYGAWKFNPKEAGFHEAATALLNRGGIDAETHEYVERFYKDYLAVTQGQPKLPIELHLKLGQRFANAGDLKQAANIINPYVQRDARHQDLPGAVLSLAEGYMVANGRDRAIRYAETVSVMFPGTPESMAARKLLGQLKRING